jgi:hypothetical protein
LLCVIDTQEACAQHKGPTVPRQSPTHRCILSFRYDNLQRCKTSAVGLSQAGGSTRNTPPKRCVRFWELQGFISSVSFLSAYFMDQSTAQGDPSPPDKEHDSKNRSLGTTLMSEPTTRVVAGPPGLTLDASLSRGNDSPATGPRCTRGSGGASPRARSGRVPWPPSPATGSPFPQLARPAPDGNGVIAGSPTADRMSPTAAPWAAIAAPTSVPAVPALNAARGAAAGRPVQGV